MRVGLSRLEKKKKPFWSVNKLSFSSLMIDIWNLIEILFIVEKKETPLMQNMYIFHACSSVKNMLICNFVGLRRCVTAGGHVTLTPDCRIKSHWSDQFCFPLTACPSRTSVECC